MNENELQKLAVAFEKYNIKIEYNGLMITKINRQPAQLNAGTYMLDQMVELICRFMQNQIIKDIWKM
ncbi:hypothetical protein [Apilactobacillus quenuiae]|uniref:hypothetical protein n=1 Tax=Apilactobacillus quenuiae TaxID=2008377 RepID=UPI000D01422F|nr:hypothetical protein [Apilactobacillus quenuiae]